MRKRLWLFVGILTILAPLAWYWASPLFIDRKCHLQHRRARLQTLMES